MIQSDVGYLRCLFLFARQCESLMVKSRQNRKVAHVLHWIVNNFAESGLSISTKLDFFNNYMCDDRTYLI